MAPATLAGRVFRLFARILLPRWFREQHGLDLLRVFEALVGEASGPGVVRVWLRELASLVALAWRLRMAGRTRGSFSGVSYLDVKLGLRMLVKDPGMTIVAVFALAIAIPVGLVPAHFARAIEAPLPVEEGDRVRAIRLRDRESLGDRPLPLASFEQWRTSMVTFGELAVTTPRGEFNVGAGDGAVVPTEGATLTGSAFDVLGVDPILGRTLSRSDEVLGAPNVVVISYDFWDTRMDRSPDAPGRDLRIGGVPHTVVGVMPEGFKFPLRASVWLPLRVELLRGEPGSYIVFGRLAEQATIKEARAEVATLYRRADGELQAADPNRLLEAQVVTFAEGFLGLPAGGFGAVLAYRGVQLLALLLLLVGCANVGMLVFSRTAGRMSELAVRTALGASRFRVITQLFTEALVFAVVAAGTGLVIADRVAVGFAWMYGMLPYWVDFRVDRVTIAWSLGLAVLSAGFVSVVPAIRLTGRRVHRSLKQASAGRSGVRFGGMSSAIIVADVMLAVAVVGLAVGGTDLLTERTNTMGIVAEEYLHASVQVPRGGPTHAGGTDEEYSQRVSRTTEELVRRLAAEPGVRAVAAANVLPGMDHPAQRIEVEGTVLSQRGFAAYRAGVAISFFDELRQPVLVGRGFTEADVVDGRRTVIVNTRLVEQALGGRNAIGQRIRLLGRNGQGPSEWLEIVGVVGSLGMNEAMPGADAGLYLPTALGDMPGLRLAIHIGSDPVGFTPRLREIATEVDPTVLVVGPAALSDVFSFNRFTVEWAGIGAVTVIGILIALSASGIFALMSFTVVRRTREIGIRRALGARKADVAMTIVRRALAQLGLGILFGMPIAWRLLHELKRDLGRIPEHSPLLLALLAGASVLVLIGLVACVVPTRRALSIMPTEALREG